MGLDMCIYMFCKPCETVDELSRKSSDVLEDEGFLIFRKNEELPHRFDAIQRFAAEVSIDTKYINIRQICEDFQVPDGAQMVGMGYSGDTTEYTFELPSGGYKDIKIPDAEFDSKYVYTEKAEAFCLECEEIESWGKRFDIRKAFHDAYGDTIKDYGYYPLNDKMWEVLRQYSPERAEYAEWYRDHEDCVICYHEST